MSHFSQSDWVDFVRGVLAPQEEAMMRRHLGEDCSECQSAAETWQRVARCLIGNKTYSPPESTVRLIKAAFGAGESWTSLLRIVQMAKLVFDSQSRQALAFVRGAKATARQLLHEAEPFVIDIRLESDSGRRTMSLIGQVLDSRYPDKVVGDVDVVLLSGDHVVARTSANASGEFGFGCSLKNDLRLFINIGGERAIGVVLPDATA